MVVSLEVSLRAWAANSTILTGILMEQRIVLYDWESVAVHLSDGYELGECFGAENLQFCEVAIHVLELGGRDSLHALICLAFSKKQCRNVMSVLFTALFLHPLVCKDLGLAVFYALQYLMGYMLRGVWWK